MDEIPITDLSTCVLEGIRNLGLREQAVRQLERNGIQPILAYFQENGRSVYSKELLEQLVWQERLKMESGVLRPERWRFLRRVASFFEQMASQGRIEETPMPRWEAEHNILFQSADRSPGKADEIETLALLTRDEVLKLDLHEKSVLHYLYGGFGAILKYFKAKGESAYSKETLDACVAEAREKFEHGEIGRSAFQHIRKTAFWIEEYRNTGKITHCKLSNVSFVYVNPNYERLIQEFREYIASEGYLKESVRNLYAWSARRFFRQMEELDHFEYRELCLTDITECLDKVADKTPGAIYGTLNALRSFSRFITEKHPELPDISPALRFVPLKYRRVYEGYTEEESVKILESIERESVQGKRNYAMIMMAYSTGLRGIDILGLKFGGIDWERREFRIVQEKTGAALALPFDTATGNAIADYILNARPDCDSEYVFVRLQRPYTKLNAMWKIVAGYARVALGKSQKKDGPYGFRRGMGRRMVEAGVPTPVICDVMGHTSTSVILQYTSASVESLRQCSGTLELIPVEQEALL